MPQPNNPRVLHIGLPHKPLRGAGIYQPLGGPVRVLEGASGASERQVMGLLESLAQHLGYQGQIYVGPGDAEVPSDVAHLVPWPEESLSSQGLHMRDQISEVRYIYKQQIGIIRGLVKSGSVDILHAHWSYSEAPLVAMLQILSEEMEVPLLCTRYTLVPMHPDVDGQRWGQYYRPYESVLRRVQMVDITESARESNPYEGNFVVETAVPEHFGAYPLATTKGNYLVYIGDMVPGKGVELACDLAIRTQTHLKLIGPKTEPEYWDEKVLKLARGTLVQFLGEQPQTHVMQLLSQAKALIALYGWQEPGSLVVQEALCTGVPVIATAEGGLVNLVEHGVTGYVVQVPPHQGAERDVRQDSFEEEEHILWQATKHLEELDQLLPAAEIRERSVNRFSFRRLAEDYDRLYRQILGR